MHLPGAGKYDVFIISPAGRPFKTKAELRTYLEKEEQDWTIHLFCLQKFDFASIKKWRTESKSRYWYMVAFPLFSKPNTVTRLFDSSPVLN